MLACVFHLVTTHDSVLTSTRAPFTFTLGTHALSEAEWLENHRFTNLDGPTMRFILEIQLLDSKTQLWSRVSSAHLALIVPQCSSNFFQEYYLSQCYTGKYIVNILNE